MSRCRQNPILCIHQSRREDDENLCKKTIKQRNGRRKRIQRRTVSFPSLKFGHFPSPPSVLRRVHSSLPHERSLPRSHVCSIDVNCTRFTLGPSTKKHHQSCQNTGENVPRFFLFVTGGVRVQYILHCTPSFTPSRHK